MWYCFLPLWESLETKKTKKDNLDCVIKSTFSNNSNITFVQVLINLLKYYHALLLDTLQHDFYPF